MMMGGGLNQNKKQLVSVVACVFNDEQYIKKCIESLLNQSYGNCEVIVVDDGSTDLTGQIARSFSEITYLHQENKGPSAARNRGIQEAKGSIVCFTDSDCEADERWVEVLVETYGELNDDRVVSVGGIHLGHPDDTGFARKIDSFMSSLGFIADYTKKTESIRKVRHNPSCCSSYLRAPLLSVGGFRENLFPGEDADLDQRLLDKGCLIYKTPDAIVFHHRPATFRQYSRMMKAYGYTSAQIARLHGIKRMIQLVPCLYLAYIVLFFGFFFINFTLGAAFLVFNILAMILVLFLLKRPACSYLELFQYLVITINQYTLGYFKGLLASRT